MAKQPENQKPNVVLGKISDKLNRPLANLIVQGYDRDMRSEEVLGESVTDKNGKYEISWLHSQLHGRGRKEADISIKVLTKEKKIIVFESGIDDIRFNASAREEINITISDTLAPEIIEYDFLLKEVTFLADKIAIDTLQENKEHRDITFLSKELEVPAEKFEHLVVAHRLQKLSKADASFFYAILRKNTLLKDDFAKNFQARHSIGIDDDDQIILFDAALTDKTRIEADVRAAVSEMLVGQEVIKNLKKNLEILAQFKKQAKAYYEKEHPRKVIELVTKILNPSKIMEVQQLFQDNKNNLNAFFETVTDPKFLDTKENIKNDKSNEAINKLFDLSKAAIPNLIKSNKIKTETDIKKLARLNKTMWLKEITNANPQLKDTEVINTYASAVVRKFEKAFPTIAFAAQLERSTKTILNNQKKIVDFFNKHENFELLKHNVDLFIKENKVSEKDKNAISNELKAVQRIFKLVPHYGKTMALLDEKIHSAYNIVSVSKTRFEKEIAPKAGLTALEAKDIFRKAEAKHTAAMLIIGDLNDSMSALSIASLENPSLAKKIDAVSKDFPNLKSLFKLTDTCECEHCRSVYSPAAYLVEILQFLDKRKVAAGNAKTILFNRRPELGEIDLSCENAETPVKYIDLVCEILEDAIAQDQGIAYDGNLVDGPDPSKGKISEKLLSTLIAAGLPVTSNALIHETETGMSSPATLPHYLRDTKLVCKIVILPDNTYKIYHLRQTMASVEELDAAPEYVNDAAYAELSKKSYAFTLPFDLRHTEARAYFDRFGESRDELMKSFQLAAGPSDEAIASESLGLTDSERQLIANAPLLNDNAAQQSFWNVAAPGTVVDYLKQVDHFLDRTGLEYKELELLLKLRFINKSGNLFIYNNDLSCDTASKEIKNLDLDVLDRIHRFLRLQKKTGLKLDTLDEVISQARLGNGNLNDDCLKAVANLEKLAKKTALKIEELICCYGEIPHTLLPYKTTTLYDFIYQNKSKNGTADPGLSIENIIKNEAAAIKRPLSDFKASISTCVNIKAIDFDKLDTSLPNDDLTFANLSSVFAMGKFMKRLKIKTDDFFILKELTGINVFGSTNETLKFYEAVTDAGKLPLKPADVKFMLWHKADNLIDREIKKDKIKSILKDLQASYQKSFNVNRSLYDDILTTEALKEPLKSQLSKLSILNETDVSILLNFVDANWKYSWVDADFVTHTNAVPGNPDSADAITFFNDKKISSLFDTAQIITNLNALQAPHDDLDTKKAALVIAESSNTGIAVALAAVDAASKVYEDVQKKFIKSWLDAISNYFYKMEKSVLLNTIIAASFKAEESLVDIILNNAKLKKIAPNTDILNDLLQTDSLIDKADITTVSSPPPPNPPNPPHPVPVLPVINEATFPKPYAAIQLLNKLFPLISSFKFSNEDVKWYLQNNQNLIWFEFDNIPFAPTQPPVAYQLFHDFCELIDMKKDLSPVINPVDLENPTTFFSIIKLVLTPATTKDELMLAIAILTGYEKDNLSAIDSYLFAAFALTNYKVIDNWKQLFECAEAMRKLSADISQISKYIKPVLDASDVSDLRINLKTRYDEATWLITLKEIMDKIRPQKRDALIAYLLATNTGIKDKNDLYEYFLVDVEMGSCMPSSRIVLAHSSIQLFVQRCLMGLEPDAMADVDEDPDWNQWKWMKNYRVWEANRKIFLYPENWYDVTLADDKSFLLDEFINELQQNELTNDTAEQSMRNYLEKLDNIAFLEVKATWYDVPTRTMHVFARTKGGDPQIYYYRRFENERSWTAWEKVELDITGEQLVAFIRNSRLCLAWLVFSEEPKPDQKTKVPAQSDQGKEIDSDKPMKKTLIQLAISEFSNKKWQPKKISKDKIDIPSGSNNYSTDNFGKDDLNLYYNIFTNRIILFSYYASTYGEFNITGCKGYPELAKDISFGYISDYLPEFTDALLLSQIFKEVDVIAGDDLSLKNGVSPFNFLKILETTPGQYRISYPLQMTKLDILSMAYQLLVIRLNKSLKERYQITSLKKPLGTLLPYFMEDSNHAYVIIPGFYNEEFRGGEIASLIGLNDDEKRTASDIFKLIDQITNWIKKISAQFTATPPADLQSGIHTIVTDPDFQTIIQEISKYKALKPLLQLMIGHTGDPAFDSNLQKLIDKEGLVYGEQFKNMYHPLICALRTILYNDGLSGLMKRETQLKVNTAFNFKTNYHPNEPLIAKMSYKQPDGSISHDYPVEDVDFASDGSYSLYNWDMFFRVPLHIATSFTTNQRFEEALTWFQYMFNPTGALSGNGVQKYWVTKPFYLNQQSDYEAQRVDSLMYAIANKSNPAIKELEFAIEEWRNKPFRPDVVARFRPVAYQKALLMKYIDNLVQWGDYLFRQFTMESVAQATQMYVLADKLLGLKPRVIPPVVKQPYETYNQIATKLDSFGNALIELENILPDISVLPESGAELPPPPVTLSMLYFCIPQNDNMLEYWNTVSDRLLKIRHCQNIDGIDATLSLFAPPIDPGMLVKAAASGLDISSILADLNAPTPFYRFNVLSQKATELVQEVRGLGNSLLQALEKTDAEALSLLRNQLELKVLNAVRDIKKLQIDEAKEQVEVLKRSKKVTEERYKYYNEIEFMNGLEVTSLTINAISAIAYTIGSIMESTAGGTALIPSVTVGGSGFGGSPVATSTVVDGEKISNSISSFAKAILLGSQVLDKVAGGISTVAGYQRRFDDWKLQERLAQKELDSIEKQISAAEIRREISETDLKNHDLQIENAKKTDEFMRSKFTNKELYDWTIRQISSVYYKSYQLAHDFAKKAERCYRFELGNDNTFISYGYWDSMKKGLQSADALMHDIKRMETSYLDKNKREYEITKHVSLASLDPLAKVRLCATGTCDFEIPEAIYDLDYPGQYFRRLKSISISLPCIAGPYTSVSAKLSLVNNRYRKNTNADNAAGTLYAEDHGNDDRFVYNVGSIQSIATSNAQNDSGIFELNFRDERYLPFEGTGAISNWRLELPSDIRQFDYNTISDVILHIKYTSREGGSGLKAITNDILVEQLAVIKQGLGQSGLHIALNIKHDLPNEWDLLKKNGTVDLKIDKSRLPYMAQTLAAAIENVMFVAIVKSNLASFAVNIDNAAADTNLSKKDEWKLYQGINSDIDIEIPFNLKVPAQLNTLEELMMVVKYSF